MSEQNQLSSSLSRHMDAAKSLAPVIEGSKKALEGSLGLLVDATKAAQSELQGNDVTAYVEYLISLHKELGL